MSATDHGQKINHFGADGIGGLGGGFGDVQLSLSEQFMGLRHVILTQIASGLQLVASHMSSGDYFIVTITIRSFQHGKAVKR
jgi:hypothetical protein